MSYKCDQSLSATIGNFNNDELPDIIISNKLYLNNPDSPGDFSWNPGVEIGSSPCDLSAAGDVDGSSPDDFVCVHPDGSVEVFIGLFDARLAQPGNVLEKTGGVGFYSAGVALPAGIATVTTINFLAAKGGYRSNCRGRDFGCVSLHRSVFLGTSDSESDARRHSQSSDDAGWHL